MGVCRWTCAIATCALLVAVTGCGTDQAASTTDANGLASDAGAVPSDAGAVALDADAVDVNTPQPSFELGTNVTGKNTRKYYSAVPENGKMNVELGPQGLWMVVLAFKTRGMFKPPLYLSGTITVDNNDSAGTLALKKQKTILSDDGFDYYYNFWLVVKNDKLPLPSAPADVAGKTATIVLEVTDADGKKHVETRKVTLTGGPNG